MSVWTFLDLFAFHFYYIWMSPLIYKKINPIFNSFYFLMHHSLMIYLLWTQFHDFLAMKHAMFYTVKFKICSRCVCRWLKDCFPSIGVVFPSLMLTLILLTWTIWRAPTNASKWRMGFNSAFKGLNKLWGYAGKIATGKLVKAYGYRVARFQFITALCVNISVFCYVCFVLKHEWLPAIRWSFSPPSSGRINPRRNWRQ